MESILTVKTREKFERLTDRATIEALSKWKEENDSDYSRFIIDMEKIKHNDYSCLERVFKMVASIVPVPVLTECERLFSTQEQDGRELTSVEEIIEWALTLKGYLAIGVSVEYFDKKGKLLDSEEDIQKHKDDCSIYEITEFVISETDNSKEDDAHLYEPVCSTEEFWDSLPPIIRDFLLYVGKKHTVEELMTISRRIYMSAMLTFNESIERVESLIHDGDNKLLLSAMYYFWIDHGTTKVTSALNNLHLSTKQLSKASEWIGFTIKKLLEKSVSSGFDKKADLKKEIRKIDDKNLRKEYEAIVDNTKGKKGRPCTDRKSYKLEDCLVGNKDYLIKEIIRITNEMKSSQHLVYLWYVLGKTSHLTPEFQNDYLGFHRVIEDAFGVKFPMGKGDRIARRIINYNSIAEARKAEKGGHIISNDAVKKIVPAWMEVFEKIGSSSI